MPRKRSGTLSKKQIEILDYIKEQVRTRNFPPSVRDICKAVELKSTSSVHSHLNTLERLGYIKRDPTLPRCIEIVDPEFSNFRREMINVPLVGTVAAGQPILAAQNITEYFPLPADRFSEKDTFMLKIKGDSMIQIGILDGDEVIVQRQDTADNGDIVVALVDDSATVKRFFREDGHYRLQPENDSMQPIIVESCEILGRVVGLMRFL
ncbi:MAG: transcriptional repressor LexA [Eubacteriales bacterium]|nr:transcriptional repressor LexA [Eubacteriales bacterium]